MDKENISKIFFKFFDEDLDQTITEGVWAKKKGQYYKIDNIPFYAYLYSTDDIVEVKEDNGELIVERLIEPSGNSTVRILFEEEQELDRIKVELSLLSCDSETSRRSKLLAVNIPKSVTYRNVINYLESIDNLQYEEACLSEHHRSQGFGGLI